MYVPPQLLRSIVLNSVNSFHVSQDKYIYNMLDKKLFILPSEEKGEFVPLEYKLGCSPFGNQLQQKKQITCNCKKTKCIKLYCDCYRIGQGCSSNCGC